ncbi:hypothetical protein GY45DRAFT_599920 [Cubamyces sp. BRFM 1775]|nr:hypothetical protein GY45DRAFT_599920 [Cubamyces sp. BRFM 1775]
MRVYPRVLRYRTELDSIFTCSSQRTRNTAGLVLRRSASFTSQEAAVQGPNGRHNGGNIRHWRHLHAGQVLATYPKVLVHAHRRNAPLASYVLKCTLH